MEQIVIGIEALKDEFRKAKIKVGDFRGIGKNKITLSEKFGITPIQTIFYSLSKQNTEINADIYYGDNGSTNAYGYSFSKGNIKLITSQELFRNWEKYH